MRNVIIAFFIITCQLSQNIFSSDQESSSEEVSHYKKSYKAEKFDINSELMKALIEEKLQYAQEIVDKNDINITYEYSDLKGETFLYILSRLRPTIEQRSYCLNIAEKLIEKGCPINKLTIGLQPCLAAAYTRSDSCVYFGSCEGINHKGEGEFLASYSNENNVNLIMFNIPLSTILIKNGALLMIEEKDEKWSILDKVAGDLRYFDQEKKVRLSINKCVIQDAFYKTFMRDYQQYKTLYLTTALIFNRFKKDKKIVIPKVLIKYIASFYIDPTEHIEETISDAWYRLSMSTHFDESIVESPCDEIKLLITPGGWKKAWVNYRGGDKNENNLVIKALKYFNNEKD